MQFNPTPPTTHPETAWLAYSFPVWLGIVLVLGGALFLHSPLLKAIQGMLVRRARALRARSGRGTILIDPALQFVPTMMAPTHLLFAGIATTLIGLPALLMLMPSFLVCILALPLAIGVMWLCLWVAEQRYCDRLDRALPAAVGRLALQLRAGDGFTGALEKVQSELSPGPLCDEWQFITGALSRPLTTGYLATATEIVTALGAQTASLRHSAFLNHVAVALQQPQDAQVSRISAAYDALLEAEQRRSNAATELSQMRYSGFAIGGASLAMFLYLASTQSQRFTLAYSGPLGLAAGALVALALGMPFVAGVLLSRVEDADY